MSLNSETPSTVQMEALGFLFTQSSIKSLQSCNTEREERKLLSGFDSIPSCHLQKIREEAETIHYLIFSKPHLNNTFGICDGVVRIVVVCLPPIKVRRVLSMGVICSQLREEAVTTSVPCQCHNILSTTFCSIV